MQIDGKIAKVYATALFELLADEPDLSDLDEALRSLYEALSKDRAVWGFLSSPVTDPDNKVELLQRALKGKAPDTLIHFLCLLALRNRMDALPGVCEEFRQMADERLGRKRALVRAAHELGDSDVQQIRDALAKYFQKEIRLESAVEPELIGGLVVQAGNLLMDRSIKSKLRRLKKQMLERKIFGEAYYEN